VTLTVSTEKLYFLVSCCGCFADFYQNWHSHMYPRVLGATFWNFSIKGSLFAK